jgi:hypothetical protein
MKIYPAQRLIFRSKTLRMHWPAPRNFFRAVDNVVPVISAYGKSVAHFYSLWAAVTLEWDQLPNPDVFAARYNSFMGRVDKLTLDDVTKKLGEATSQEEAAETSPVLRYFLNAQSATTDAGPRLARHEILKQVIINDEGA